MSWGILICSTCKREVHQRRSVPGDFNSKLIANHCDDSTPICEGAHSAYPDTTADIVGVWCGRDKGPDE